MAGALLSTLTTGTLTGGEGGTISSTTVSNLLGAENYAIYDAMKDSITDRNYPRVYLNYLSFDESFNILPEECSITQMKGPDHVWNMLTQPGYISRKNGYVLAYVSNESDVVTFIDNTTFTIHYGQLQQEQHYYPHGLVLDAGLATGALKSNYLFEGNELQPHLNLQLSDFNYRQYDQQIGRFTSVDPLADASGQEMFSPYHFVGNDPANYTDPLGLTGTWQALMGGGQNYNRSSGGNGRFWAGVKNVMKSILSVFATDGGGGPMPASDAIPMNTDNPMMIIASAMVSPGGGAISVGTKFLKRDIKEQQEKNQNTYRQDMARNYGGSIGNRGSVTFDHVTYDLPAFSKWYDNHHNAIPKFASRQPFKGSTEFATSDGMHFKAYAETVGNLVLVMTKGLWDNQTVTTGKNYKTSNDLFRSDLPAMELFKIGTIHSHLPSGILSYRNPMGFATMNIQPGPSDAGGDWSAVSNNTYFSVIVDDKYIYLYRHVWGSYEIHKYDRFNFKEIK